MDALLTKHEAAKMLKVSPATVDRYAREKRLERVYLGGKRTVRFREADIVALTGSHDQSSSGNDHEAQLDLGQAVNLVISHCVEIPRPARQQLRDALDYTESRSRKSAESRTQ